MKTRSLSSAAGFTLVELLVVMAIIALLTALTVTGFRSVNTALSLSTATQAVTTELTTARQTALTLDETVQVRFYQYPDSTGQTTTKEYQSMQSFKTQDGKTYTPIDKITYFPATIMISANTTYSAPLGTTTATPAATTDVNITSNGVGHGYSYVPINFKSNGMIDPQPGSASWPITAANTPWFITLYEKKYAAGGTPVNYTTISVDPQDGRMRMFQP